MTESSTNNPSTFKRRLRKVTFFMAKVFAAIFVMFLLLFAWVYTGPRSIPFIANYITKHASELLPPTSKLEIEDVMIAVDDMNITLRVVHPRVIDSVKGDFELSKVDLKLDLLGFVPQSNHNLLNIEISEPKLQLHKLLAEDGESASEEIKISTINDYLRQHKEKIAKLSLSLSKTSLSLNTSDSNVVDVMVNELTIAPVIKKGNIIINLYGDINIGGKTNSIEAVIDTQNDQHLNIRGTVSNISSTLLDTLGYPIAELENSHVEADISFDLALKGFRNVESVKFDISNFQGKINKNYFFPTDITPSTLIARGEIKNNFETLNVDLLKISDSNLSLTSKFTLSKSKGVKKLKGSAQVENLQVNKIKEYWPTPVIARTREWIFEHISEGSVKKVVADFDINLDDLIAKKSLRKDELKVEINLAGSSIFYMDNVPKIKDIDGDIYINPDEISFEIKKGKMLDAKIIKANGRIPSLGSSKSRVNVEADVAGGLQSLIDIGFSHADIKNDRFKNLKGDSEAHVKVSIPLDDSDITLKSIGLEVDAKAKNVSASKIYKDYTLSGGNFTAKFKDMAANISGTGSLNNSMPVDVMHYINFESNNQVTKVKAKFNWDNLEKFNIKKPDIVANMFEATLEIQDSAGVVKELVDVDLTNSTVAYEPLGIYKKIGEPGRVRVHVVEKDWGYEIDEYSIDLINFQSAGKIKLDSSYSLLSVESNKTQFGRGEFALKYERKKDSDVIQISGPSFDYDSINPAKMRGAGTSSEQAAESKHKESRGLYVKAKIGRLYMKNDVVLISPTINVDCTAQRCQTILLKGMTGNGKVVDLNYQYPNLVMNSDDAATVFAAFGISDKLIGGKLYMSGKMSPDMKFDGNFVVTDFALKKAPILAKILSLASLTVTSFEGVETLLGNKGVKFTKASCPFTYNYGVLFIDDCVAKGSTIAIVAKGDVNFNSQKINVNGTAIPENIINTAVKNIPVLNDLFGKKNKEDEVFGVSFRVVGNIDDPEVKSNPLSLLTPGFLRKVFEGPSSSKPTEKPNN